MTAGCTLCGAPPVLTCCPLCHLSARRRSCSPPQGCFRHLRTMFQELEEIRPFELLKSQADRVNYLMTKQVGGCGWE